MYLCLLMNKYLMHTLSKNDGTKWKSQKMKKNENEKIMVQIVASFHSKRW